MDEDKKEEQKKADVDRSKLEADIEAQTDVASTVSLMWKPYSIRASFVFRIVSLSVDSHCVGTPCRASTRKL